MPASGRSVSAPRRSASEDDRGVRRDVHERRTAPRRRTCSARGPSSRSPCTTIARLWCAMRRLRLLREQQRHAQAAERRPRSPAPCAAGVSPSMTLGHRRERELVDVHVPASGVAKQHQQRRSRSAARRRSSPARAHRIVASHKATPGRMNASAVSRDIRGQPGTMLVSGSMSNVQPANTNRPTASATKATNCARLRLGSALSGMTMICQTTPMPAVPQLGSGRGTWLGIFRSSAAKQS